MIHSLLIISEIGLASYRSFTIKIQYEKVICSAYEGTELFHSYQMLSQAKTFTSYQIQDLRFYLTKPDFMDRMPQLMCVN